MTTPPTPRTTSGSPSCSVSRQLSSISHTGSGQPWRAESSQASAQVWCKVCPEKVIHLMLYHGKSMVQGVFNVSKFCPFFCRFPPVFQLFHKYNFTNYMSEGKTPVMISEDAKYDDGVVQEQVCLGEIYDMDNLR